MNQPRPESRISALEKRASTLEAQIVELSSDTAESLRDLKQDIKQLSGHIDVGFNQAHAYIDHHMAELKATMATKEDLHKLETRFDKLETRFDKLEATQDLILQLLQQKSDKPL